MSETSAFVFRSAYYLHHLSSFVNFGAYKQALL